MGFVKNFKDKINEHFVNNEYDEYEPSLNDEDEYEETGEAENTSSIYDSLPEPDFSFEAAPGINVPEYSYEPKTSAPKKKPESAAPAKQNANIYNISNAKPANKFKLNSILLRDIYDAKNVAALMMERDTIIVVNLSLLSDDQKIRAMDFLDGAKFVTKSVFARFAENICAFVPETVELFGDFFSQIDLDSFNK